MKRLLPHLLLQGGLLITTAATSAPATDSLKVSFYYETSRSDIDADFVRHQRQIRAIANRCVVDSVRVYGYTSPEGGEAFNRALSLDRAEALARQAATEWPEAIFTAVDGRGTDPHHSPDRTNWPYMRRADMSIWYHPAPNARPATPAVSREGGAAETPEEAKPVAVFRMPVYETVRRPVLYAGANVPYLLGSAPNISVEIPAGRASFYAEHLFPWWVLRGNRSAVEDVHSCIGARWWFGDRTARPALSGWYAGIAAEAGMYDIEPDGKGRQGEFAGITAEGGYAWTLGGDWRVTAGIGAGTVWTTYRNYEGRYGHEYLVWTGDTDKVWTGPIRIRVNIGYVFHRKHVRKASED